MKNESREAERVEEAFAVLDNLTTIHPVPMIAAVHAQVLAAEVRRLEALATGLAQELARRDEARDAALLNQGRAEAFEEAAHYHDDFASHLVTAFPHHEASEKYRRIHLRDAGIFQERAAACRDRLSSPSPASSEPCQGIKKGLRCSPCVSAKRTCQPEGVIAPSSEPKP